MVRNKIHSISYKFVVYSSCGTQERAGWTLGEIALMVEGLNHRYGRRTVLTDIGLALERNRIYGLLGRNGAGKTTLLNLVSASMRSQSGRIEIFGARPFERPGTLRRMCYVRERGLYPPGLRVRDALDFAARAFPNWDGAYARGMLGRFELSAKKRFKQLSRGMESSLGLVVGLASRAELTIFDEPSLGLDAAVREYFYQALREDVIAHPRTVVVSTHLIDEVSNLFEDVVILKEGRVLLSEPREALLSRYAYLVGPREAVERAAAGREALKWEELAGMSAVCVPYQGEALPEGVRAAPVPLQKLFISLTEGGGAR